jgi:hypothetical protein
MEQDIFTHMSQAAEASADSAIDTAASSYAEAIALSPRMVRAHAKLIEILLLSGADDPPGVETFPRRLFWRHFMLPPPPSKICQDRLGTNIGKTDKEVFSAGSETRKRTESAINNAVATTLAAVETGATARVGAANLNRIATTLLDAAMVQKRWEQADALDKCEDMYKQAAALAERSDSAVAVEKLSGHISLQLGQIHFARSEVPGQRLTHLPIALEILQDAM